MYRYRGAYGRPTSTPEIPQLTWRHRSRGLLRAESLDDFGDFSGIRGVPYGTGYTNSPAPTIPVEAQCVSLNGHVPYTSSSGQPLFTHCSMKLKRGSPAGNGGRPKGISWSTSTRTSSELPGVKSGRSPGSAGFPGKGVLRNAAKDCCQNLPDPPCDGFPVPAAQSRISRTRSNFVRTDPPDFRAVASASFLSSLACMSWMNCRSAAIVVAGLAQIIHDFAERHASGAYW